MMLLNLINRLVQLLKLIFFVFFFPAEASGEGQAEAHDVTVFINSHF